MLTSIPPAPDRNINVEELLRSKSFLEDVMSFLGHDLRNQLSVLELANSRMMLEFQNIESEQQQQVFKRMKQAIFMLQRTAHKYLNTAHMEDPKFRITTQLLDPLKEIIEPFLFLHEDDLAETKQACQVEIFPTDTLCWADWEFLYSTMDSLLENAIKFGNPNGLIRIEIAERGKDHEFSIWNSGAGLEIDDLERIFDRYSDQMPGSENNIGLYLSKKMVEAHKGHIWADSRPGEWTRITFTLPRRLI